MRITRETLLKLARDTITQRARADRGIVAAYLHGSLLEDEPLLGGTADIDLFIVHNDTSSVEREIVRITDEVILDITHHPRNVYRQSKELRLHPWLGPTIFECKILYDPQHFMDFTQAGVRGQFNRSDQVLGRARPQVEHARQMWMDFDTNPPAPGLESARLYLRIVEHAVNAVALVSGAPLTERRFLLKFPERAKAAKHPGLHPGLLGLLGAPAVNAATLKSWLPDWLAVFQAIPTEQRTPRFSLHRQPYYLRALEALAGSVTPHAALWPLWHSWTLAASLLPAGSPLLEPWQRAGEHLGLLGPAFTEKITALDSYLDMVEEMLEVWARENGA